MEHIKKSFTGAHAYQSCTSPNLVFPINVVCREKAEAQRLPIPRFEFLFLTFTINDGKHQRASPSICRWNLEQCKTHPSYENLHMQPPHPFWKIGFQECEMQKIIDCLQSTIKMIQTSKLKATFFPSLFIQDY